MFYKDLLLKKPSEIYLLVWKPILFYLFTIWWPVNLDLCKSLFLKKASPFEIAVNLTIPKEKNCTSHYLFS